MDKLLLYFLNARSFCDNLEAFANKNNFLKSLFLKCLRMSPERSLSRIIPDAPIRISNPNPMPYLNVPIAFVFVVGSITHTATELATFAFVSVPQPETNFGFT